MKLRITVQDTQYDVDVEIVDESTDSITVTQSTSRRIDSGGEVISPIAGTVFDIRVKPGDQIKINDTLLVLEAMKMESNIASTVSGTVKDICVKIGDSVANGQVLVRVE